ncbi:class I SAM-dependent methyltransferase, partial [Rossellomorea marisflavi]
MFVTTSGRADESVKLRAKTLAEEFQIPYIERKKRSIANYMSLHQADCLVLGKERDELHRRGEQPFFFHPNSASFRIKRVLRGESDPFIEAAGLKKGMTMLDCTLGLASDSIIASAVVGRTGSVTGVEANPYVAQILKRGMKEWVSPLPELNDAMRRVEVIDGLSQSFLKELPDDSFDVVYFDPMFEEGLTDS